MSDAPEASAARGPKLPETIGGYSVLRRLSRGGMGEVLLGTRQVAGFDKKVAIKVVLQHFNQEEDYRQLFFDEAELVARMSHPNLTQVFDFGEDDGVLYLVMEYVDGVSVEKLMTMLMDSNDRAPPAIAGLIAAQTARGLHSAHTLVDGSGQSLGVVHRDVSPQNLIVTWEGCTKVLDFGIARSKVRQAVTQMGVVRGKPGYMAPEQARAKPLDARTDIFQLGIVLFELLTGQQLFVRPTVYGSIAAAVEEPVPDLLELVPGIDPGFKDVVECALTKDHTQRFSTADAMARALDVVIARCGRPMTDAALGDYIRRVTGREAASAPSPAEEGRPDGQGTMALNSSQPEVPDATTVKMKTPPANLPLPSTQTSSQPKIRTVTTDAAEDSLGTAAGIEMWRGPQRRATVVAAGVAIAVVLGGLALWGAGDDDAGAARVSPVAPLSAISAEQRVDVAAPPEDPAGDDGVAAVAVPDPAPPAIVQNEPPKRTKVRTAKKRARSVPRKTGPAVADEPAPEPDASPSAPAPAEPAAADAPAAIENSTPPTPEKKRFGRLTVVATQWANVEVDGRSVGTTPVINLPVEAGNHVVEIFAPDTKALRLKRTVVVRENQTERVRVPD